MTTTAASGKRPRSSSAAFLLSAKAFVLSSQNQSDKTLFPKYADDEHDDDDDNETHWFDCLHIDCIGNRPYAPSQRSTTIVVVDFFLVIMIAFVAVYFLLNDFLIGGLGKSNGRFVSFCDSFRTCFVFRQIENQKHKRKAGKNSPNFSKIENRKHKREAGTNSPHSPLSPIDDCETEEKSCLSQIMANLALLLRNLRIKYSIGTLTSLLLSKWPVWMLSIRHVGSFFLSYVSINSQFNLIFETLARSLLLQLVLNTTAALYKYRKLNFASSATAEMGMEVWSSLCLSLMVGEGVSFGFAYDKYSRRHPAWKSFTHAAYHMMNWRVCCTVMVAIILCMSHRFSGSLTPETEHIFKCIAFVVIWMRYCASTAQAFVKRKVIDPLISFRRWMCDCTEPKTIAKETTAGAHKSTTLNQSTSHLKQD